MSIAHGTLARMVESGDCMNCVVQVISIKQAGGRYQCMVRDASETSTAMFATQLNIMVEDGSVTPNCLLEISKYLFQPVGQSKVLIIMGATVVGYHEGPAGGALPAPPAPMAAPANSYASAYPAASGGNYGSYQQQPPQSAAPAPSTYYGSGGAPNMTNNKPVYKDDSAGASIIPISDIYPYSSRWTIKARITNKSDIRRWSNAKGEGTLFSIDLLDNQGGEIRATFFKESCEKFFPVLEEGKVYTLAGGTLKIVQNRQYTTIKNQYELTFGIHANIQAASDDRGISKMNFSFVKIKSINETEPNSTVDVIAIVRAASEVSTIVSTKQAGKVLEKRELTLVDDSLSEIRVTIWGEKATSAQYDWQSNPIVAFKGLRVSDYGGRSLGAISGTSITVSPEVPEGIELFNWRNSFPGGVIPLGQSLSSAGGSGGGIGNDSIEKRIELSAIKDNNMGVGEKPDWATVKGSISFLKHDNDPWYTACTGADCNKKVVEGPGGNWICEKCNITTQECNYRYVLSLCLIDNSASTWVSLFNEQAEALLGKTAKELYDMRANDNQADYERVFSDCMFRPYLTKLRIKQETVGDEMRTKSVANAMAPMDYPGECRKLIEAINKY